MVSSDRLSSRPLIAVHHRAHRKRRTPPPHPDRSGAFFSQKNQLQFISSPENDIVQDLVSPPKSDDLTAKPKWGLECVRGLSGAMFSRLLRLSWLCLDGIVQRWSCFAVKTHHPADTPVQRLLLKVARYSRRAQIWVLISVQTQSFCSWPSSIFRAHNSS